MKVIPISVLLWSVTAIGQVQVEVPVAEGFISAEKPSTEQELAPYTIIKVETVQDLENYLSGGYPTSEIQAILDDESIPEEDRYWLDCRMRSMIAQLLHRFYDEHGNVIEIYADWIKPGEDYWQETMMVNPPGRSQLDVPGSPHCPVEPGPLLNLFGEEVASLTTIGDLVRFSRDGSLAITQTGYRSRAGDPGGEMYFCFMYPDGSFKEIEFPDRNMYCDRTYAVSQDGSITAWNVYNIRDEEESYLLVYDGEGNELESYELPFQSVVEIGISPDNRVISCAAHGRDGSCIVDRELNSLSWFSSGSARQPMFSANSKFCVLPEGWLNGNSIVVDILNTNHYSIANRSAFSQNVRGARDIRTDNSNRIVLVGGEVYLDTSNILSCPDYYEHNSISPNGYFCFLGDARLNFVLLNLSSPLEE